LLGTLATAYAQSQRIDDAVSTVQKALEILPLSVSDTTRARLYQQAAYVYHFLADTKRTETYASLAIELALARGLYEIAARGFSVLYTIRYEADNIAGCVEALEHLGECARKSASIQARLFGLMAAYEIEVERGNDDAIARIYRELQEAHSTFTPARAQALMPALAIQSAWSGRFQEAYELRASTAQSDSNYERRALRAAETSLYAFASGLHEAGQSALHDAFVSLKQFSRTTLRALLARVFLALAELLRGHHASAHRLLTEVEQRVSSGTPRLQAFVNAVRVQYRMSLGQATTDEWQAAMERLRANHYAGIARLLAALPTSQAEPAGYATLTPSERDILELLAAGASTKDIAIRTKRSPHTVDTHIRAICRKLSCSGRREAVALAVGNGWVHR
jgi:DNA-binding CsgD family transcriptional regulator